MLSTSFSLRKHPFLLALRRWGRFARRKRQTKRPHRRRAKRNGCFRRLDKFTYKILATNLGACKTNLLYHLYITCEVKQYYEALFLSYRPRRESSISQFWNTNIQDDRSTRGLLAKQLKKFPKSPVLPAGSHFCSASCGLVFE